MFHDGDLQSGIAVAIQQQKLVACFVREDDDEESKTWEEDWFAMPMEDSKTLGDVLSEKAVLLKLNAGSQEAGFLSAFCSLEKTPKLVIISNGSVLEDIEAGVSREEFMMRITSVLDRSVLQQSASTPAPPASSSAAAQPGPSSAAQTATPATSDPDNVQAMMAERAARLEKIKQQKEKAEKDARKVIAEARKMEEEKAAAGQGPPPHSRQTYIDQQKDRQKQARMEKERVLKMIEADKAARKEREQQRRVSAQAEQAEAGPSTAPNVRPVQSNAGRVSSSCSLQIRLFDGSSVRGRFDSSATLSSAVRTYVSEQSSTFQPYNFRLMQVPGPSRTIDISEEGESLLSLGLCPNATLVLVPVKDYTTAYSGAHSNSIMNWGLATTYSVVGAATGMVGGVLGRITGYGGGASEGPYIAGMGDEQEPSNVAGSRMAEASMQPGPSSGVKIRTLADQRRENKDAEFYNGNQLNFEPRKDEDKQD